MRKFVVPGVIGLLMATAIGWYFVSPTWTLHQMASAARAKDADRLSAYIDFPKLRDTTKAQLKAQASARIASGNSKGFEALGLMIGVSMIDTMIDGILTPQGIAAMFANVPADSAPGQNQAKKPFGIDANNREVVRVGLNQFRLHDKRAHGSDGDLVFERHGLGWELAEIIVPQNLMDTRPRGPKGVPPAANE